MQVLLFSSSTKMLNRVEDLALARGHGYSRLDGSTCRSDRQKLVDDFNSKPSILLFLISTLAGGVGLNLASANRRAPTLSPSFFNLQGRMEDTSLEFQAC